MIIWSCRFTIYLCSLINLFLVYFIKIIVHVYVESAWKQMIMSVSSFFVFFSFFSFAYTTSPAAVMKLVIFSRSSKPPYNFWWSGVGDGHCAIRSGWCLLHLWRTCSVVWSSSPQGHVGEGTILVSCACVRWACSGRNAVVPKTNWPGLSRRWYAFFSFLGFSAVLMMVLFSW